MAKKNAPKEETSVVNTVASFEGMYEITGELDGFWEPAEGDEIVGWMEEVREGIGEYENALFCVRLDGCKARVYKKDNEPDTLDFVEDGGLVGIWEAFRTVVFRKTLGLKIGIKYKGKTTTSGGNNVKLFKLYVAAPPAEAARLRSASTGGTLPVARAVSEATHALLTTDN